MLEIEPNNSPNLPSQLRSHAILANFDPSFEDYGATIVDKLKIRTFQPLNHDTLSHLIRLHNETFKSSALKMTGRITVESPSNPFTVFLCNDSSVIVLNPNKYLTHANVNNFLNSLIDGYDPSEAVVMAIDFNVDVNKPFETIFEAVTIKHKRKTVIHCNSGKVTGVYYGHRRDQLVIYDKAFQKGLAYQNITRLERRFAGNYCPIRRLSEIESLKTKTPFGDIHFTALSGTYPKDPAEEVRLLGIQQMVQRYGGQVARKKLSSQGHFNRDYARYFQSGEPVDLNQEYQRRLSLYLKDPSQQGGEPFHA